MKKSFYPAGYRNDGRSCRLTFGIKVVGGYGWTPNDENNNGRIQERTRRIWMKSHGKHIVTCVALIVLACVLIAFSGWGIGRVTASTSTGKTRAVAYLSAYARHVGAHDSVHHVFDQNDDRSFGDFGLHYFPNKDILEGRVFIVRSHIKEWPETAAKERQTIAGLNDPKIGGMYDRGGGHFILDEEKQAYFLVKDYPLDKVPLSQFIADFDNLNDLGGIWLTKWLGHAANQSHGDEPLPTQRIDRQHDPYPRT